jgi:predicted lipid-binding transport protein (Tim44 family)
MNAIKRLVRGWRFRIALAAVAGLVAVATIGVDAEAARRFGGGKSFGRQSQNVERQQMQPPARDSAGQSASGQQGAQAAGPAAQPQPARNRWMGPLAGLAAGLGIVALLSALGLSGAFAQALGSLLVVALLVAAALFVWRMLRGPAQQAAARGRLEPGFEAPAAGTSRIDYGSSAARPGSVAATLGSAGAPPAPGGTPSATPWGVPEDFDVEGFLRNAKVHFIRLQAAWDARDLEDIREFTTPEVFGEIRMQLSEDAGHTHTDVVTLAARLLGIEETDSEYIASVRFDGSLREGQGVAEPVSEVWNLSKPKRGNRGWLLAGVQQLQ